MKPDTSLNVTLDKLSNETLESCFPGNLSSAQLKTFLELTVERSSDGIFWLNSDAQITYVNDSASTRLDYLRSELIGKYVWDLDPLFPQKIWPQYWSEFVQAGHIQFESQHTTKFGKVLPVFIRAVLIVVDGKEMQIAYVQDLTEQKVQEAQFRNFQQDVMHMKRHQDENPEPGQQDYLKKVAERLSKLEMIANIGTWEVDIKTNQLIWSEQTRRIHEVEADYQPNVENAIAFYKEGYDRDTILKLFNNAVSASVPWDVELTIITQAGRERIVRVIGNAESHAGQCQRVFGVFQDITDSYGLRRELLESQKSLQDIMDHSPAVVYVKDLQGRYLFVNHKFLADLQLKREQVIGNTDEFTLPPLIAQEIMENDKRVIASGKHVELEEIIPLHQGERLYISEKFPLFDSTGKIYALCGISTDITERRQQEEQLRRSQKMDALGKLTGGVAHDFNNLLGIMVGYAGLIEQRAELLDSSIMEHAQQITKACERGEKLTRRMLAFSSKQSLIKQKVNLNDVILNNVDMLQKIMTVSIELQLQLSPELKWCSLDISDFEDALINLVLNALYAMEHKGRLTITTKNKKLVEGSEHSADKTDEFVIFSVADSGCGMDKHTKERLFEPFFTTKEEKGTGLGLSQVYGFTQRSNAKIEVQTEPGKGTCFEFSFPACEAPPGEDGNGTETKSVKLSGSGKILVVDDEKELVEISRIMLSQHGYTVTGCTDAETALDFLKKESFDLLISDVIMPNMDGWELSEQVLKRFPETQVLLVSGYIGERNHDVQIQQLKLPVLNKPFSSETLLKRVKELLTAT